MRQLEMKPNASGERLGKSISFFPVSSTALLAVLRLGQNLAAIPGRPLNY
jgi:hypothetical protein